MQKVTIHTSNPFTGAQVTQTIYFDTMINKMDHDLREQIYMDLYPCSEQKFADEYVKRHLKKFGTMFFLG
jgi:hypothetical protein